MNNTNQLQPHIQCSQNDIADIVLLPGNPDRVLTMAREMDAYREVARNREFFTVTGTYKGIPLSITSTGIGCASTAIAAEELINCGARVLVRTGTCGSAWRSDIAAGSVIVPTACVRDEGTTTEYMPLGFPAVADPELVYALMQSAAAQQIQAVQGINRTHDAFYAPQQSMKSWGAFYDDERFSGVPSPIISSEMEAAALFVVASMRGVQAAAMLAVDAEPTPLEDVVLGKQQYANETYSSVEVSAAAQQNMLAVAFGALPAFAATLRK